jgi:hypothetical protein
MTSPALGLVVYREVGLPRIAPILRIHVARATAGGVVVDEDTGARAYLGPPDVVDDLGLMRMLGAVSEDEGPSGPKAFVAEGMPGFMVAKLPAEPRPMNLRLEFGDRDPVRFAVGWQPSKLPEPQPQPAPRKSRGRSRKQVESIP